MKRVVVELDEGQAQRLREHAVDAGISEQELCREALESYLQGREPLEREPRPAGHEALRRMIGLVVQGPTDASVAHDVNPADAP